MKLTTLILSIFLSCNLFAKLQDSTKIKNILGKNEVYFSYGFLSVSNMIIDGGFFSSFNPQLLSANNYKIKENYNQKFTKIPPAIGSLNIGYKRYFIKNKLCVSANFIYCQINAKYVSQKNDSLNYNIKDRVFCVLPGVEYHYYNKSIVQLYSGFHLGICYYNQKQSTISNKNTTTHSQIKVAFQADLFGIRVGKKIGGFIELGVGYNGIIKVGISGRF